MANPSFIVTDEFLANLKAHGVPALIVDLIGAKKGHKFESYDKFVQHIGEQLNKLDGEKLLKELLLPDYLWRLLGWKGSLGNATVEVFINPLPGDPDAVPSGNCQFCGYYVNAKSGDTLAVVLYLAQVPPGTPEYLPADTPTVTLVSGSQWFASSDLSPNSDYLLVAALGTSSTTMAFSTGD